MPSYTDWGTMSVDPVIVWRDRLAGTCRPEPPEPTTTLIGRWTIERREGAVFVNASPAQDGDFLVPDGSGRWDVLAPDEERLSGSTPRPLLPSDEEEESVRALGERLGRLQSDGAGWLEWLEIVPLAPGIDEKLALTPLEELVRNDFGHLESICHRPRAHLKVERETVFVSKARRIPSAAYAYLAAHTEDWERPLIRGVLPKRILAEVRTDELNIYENRVVARLRDNLATHVGRRATEMARLLTLLKEKENFSSDLGGTYQRSRRIAMLWGELMDSSEARRKAEDTLEALLALKYRLMGLVDSSLYSGVPPKAHVPTTLKTSNILTNDQHYRRAADMWREWAKTGAAKALSPLEIYERWQQLCESTDAFAMLLTVRALDVLGYEPSGDDDATAIAPGATLRLQRGDHEIRLHWRPDGTVAVDDGARELAIVSLVTNVGNGTEEQTRSVLRQLDEANSSRENSKLLILYLGASGSKPDVPLDLRRSLHTAGNDPRCEVPELGCLPISAWEIGSTERVARALRWFLAAPRFLDYPATVSLPSQARGAFEFDAAKSWLRVDKDSVTITRPPQPHELVALGLDEGERRATQNLRDAVEAHGRLTNELRAAVRSGKTGNLAGEKAAAAAHKKACEDAEEAVHAVAAELRTAIAQMNALLNCPTCGAQADPGSAFEPRGDCFKCTCVECNTQWETRLCGQRHRYSAMRPSGRFIDADEAIRGWEDKTYGCDVLAVPARSAGGSWGFVCPACGEIR